METTIKKATATKALKICGMVLNVILEGFACLMYCLLVGVTTIIMAIPFNPIIYWIWGLVVRNLQHLRCTIKKTVIKSLIPEKPYGAA